MLPRLRGAELLGEVLREERNVDAAPPQRRHVERHGVEPVDEILAEAALVDRRLESRCVAETRRTSTMRDCGRAERAHLARSRSRAAASPGGRRWCRRSRRGRACRRRPPRRARAWRGRRPVKAPRSWPKSSLSSSVSGSAPQLTATKRRAGARDSARGSRARRAPCRCRSRPGSAPRIARRRDLRIWSSTWRIARTDAEQCAGGPMFRARAASRAGRVAAHAIDAAAQQRRGSRVRRRPAPA